MPFALVFLGLLFVVTGAKGTQSALGQEIKADFTGPGNFTWWLVALGAVGSLGYIEQFRAFSRWFMALILVAMLVKSNSGFFDQFTKALQSGPISPPEPKSENTAPAMQFPNTTAKPISTEKDTTPQENLGKLVQLAKSFLAFA